LGTNKIPLFLKSNKIQLECLSFSHLGVWDIFILFDIFFSFELKFVPWRPFGMLNWDRIGPVILLLTGSSLAEIGIRFQSSNIEEVEWE